ncbi:MAG: IS481 family transposase [Myxococcaceae bacterium]
MNLHKKARTCPESRALLVDRVVRLGWKVTRAADAAGVSTRTAHKWLNRYEFGGEAELNDRSSRPKSSPLQLGPAWVELILMLRRSRMSGPAIATRLQLPKSTVARILKRNKVSRLRALEPVQPIVRYEWPKPGDMLHLDVKKLGRIKGLGHRITGLTGHKRNRGIGWDFVHVCVDDASRVAYVEVLPDETGVTTVGFLKRALAWFRSMGVRVRRILTDNGTNYRSLVFAHCCARLRLQHRRTKPYTPRTNGKAERFIQTLLRECAYAMPFISSAQRSTALRGWLRHYNEDRLHGTIRMTPFARLKAAA